MNDPDVGLRAEYERKKRRLTTLKKEIKQNPDQRYIERKELGADIKGLHDAILERMEEGEEVTVGTRRFKKQRIERVKYTKDGIRAYCTRHEMDPVSYDEENVEEAFVLKAT